MAQTLVVIVLFVGAVAMLPWLVRRIQQHKAGGNTSTGAASRVLSAIAVGPSQRVVTIEVGPEDARTWLVLGVTAQQINCLHVLTTTSEAAVTPPSASFATLMTQKTIAPDLQHKDSCHA